MAQYTQWQIVLIVLACGLIVSGTIIGNILVCTAVAIVRKLRTPSNLLIVSLAVSDLLVAVLVMPLATSYEVFGRWPLGPAVCDMWTSLDVMLCTASILSLCAISVDRYFVITRPFQYAMKRTPLRMTLMILSVWLLSALISIPPLFGWQADQSEGNCVLSQAIGYQVYATIGAFYLPLTVMIVIYYRIYMVSSGIAEAEAKSKPNGGGAAAAALTSAKTPMRRCSDDASSYSPPDSRCQRCSLLRKLGTHNGCIDRSGSSGSDFPKIKRKKKDVLLAKNENKKQRRSSTSGGGGGGVTTANRASLSKDCKATKTLGIIMGAFTACWLPFFILALIKPFCSQGDGSCIPHWLNSLFLWLGYTNSFLNPIIYARFNRDFRKPFKEILLLRCRGINTRLRSETYAEQFGRPEGLGTGLGGSAGDAVRRGTTRGSCSVVYQSVEGRTLIRLDDCKEDEGSSSNNFEPKTTTTTTTDL